MKKQPIYTTETNAGKFSKRSSSFWKIFVLITIVFIGLAMAAVYFESTSEDGLAGATISSASNPELEKSKKQLQEQLDKRLTSSTPSDNQVAQPTTANNRNVQPQVNYTPTTQPTYTQPVDPCNYNLKSSYDSQYYSALNYENSSYNTQLSQINSALSRLAIGGASDSSTYRMLQMQKTNLISKHNATLKQIEADYQANLATTGCTV